ncbi:NAD(P)-binding protein [Microbacterium sp. NPDC089695]|uniref:NAD(P)-binding protein n=1 Tax=Microbacterium sp. NPDC089695 TaxID=3364198 RepID=UPI0037F42FC9
MHDAVIVGRGPNGLAAGVVLARARLDVVLFDANDQVGAGAPTIDSPSGWARREWGTSVHRIDFASRFYRELSSRTELTSPRLRHHSPNSSTQRAHSSLG